ncbi:MAG: methyltransferase domain-containing protein [Deltaproteobacteria bacterium]|nr:methyltransferase domain-containing protein [Deltaproteobacteria bacterium]
MKTEWDYTSLAKAYLKRPDYSDEAIDRILDLSGVRRGSLICDVGAGVAHLTLKLAQRGMEVVAIEPNDAMRQLGIRRTASFQNVRWCEGTGEETGQPRSRYDLVTFGSSFNVTDRMSALKETCRILKPGGWFACLWNHRDLRDDIQQEIERIIRNRLPDYDYGTRREDQQEVIESSGLFGEVHRLEGRILHRQSIDDCVEAWRSHGTLARQAGSLFEGILGEIEAFLRQLKREIIAIPYTTRGWLAQASK